MPYRLPVAALLMLAVLAGCAEPPTAGLDVAGGPPADSAFALLTSMERGAMQRAFAGADSVGLLRLTRTEQLAPGGAVMASSERLVRLRPGTAPVTLRLDTAGTFRFGALARFVDAPVDRLDAGPPVDPTEHVLPEDPAFLSARNREAFVYTPGPDTVLFGRPAHVVTVRARPGTGDAQAVRRARLLIDVATGDLVGVTLVRRADTWFYDEAGRYSLLLRPAPDGWQPHRTDVLAATRLPFIPTRTFRTASVYFPDPATR